MLGGPLRVVRRQRQPGRRRARACWSSTPTPPRRRHAGRRATVRRLGAGEVVAVVNTHEHFDHTFGNGVFPEAYGAVPVHAHEDGRRAPVEQRGERCRSRPRDRRARRPAAATRSLATQIVLPDQTFSSARGPRPRRPAGRAGAPRPRPHRPATRWCGSPTPTCCSPATWSRSRAAGTPCRATATTATRWSGRPPSTSCSACSPPGSVVVPGHGRRWTGTSCEEQRGAIGVVAETIRDLAGPRRAGRATRWPRPSGPTRPRSSRTPYGAATSSCRRGTLAAARLTPPRYAASRQPGGRCVAAPVPEQPGPPEATPTTTSTNHGSCVSIDQPEHARAAPAPAGPRTSRSGRRPVGCGRSAGGPDRLRTRQVGEQRPARERGPGRPGTRGPLVVLVLGQPAGGVVLAERGDRGLPLGVADPQLGAAPVARRRALPRLMSAPRRPPRRAGRRACDGCRRGSRPPRPAAAWCRRRRPATPRPSPGRSPA